MGSYDEAVAYQLANIAPQQQMAQTAISNVYSKTFNSLTQTQSELREDISLQQGLRQAISMW